MKLFKRSHKVSNVYEWINLGVEMGWCGPPVCVTHDGMPMTGEEEDEFVEGNDICVHMIRPYHDSEEKALIEEAHAPSVWRK